MTIQEALTAIDELKHNAYTQEEKIRWLSTLDHAVKEEILSAYPHGDRADFSGYNADTPLDTRLLIPAPYHSVYIHWLEAQMDYFNGETQRHNNAMAEFQSWLDAFAAWYNRTHLVASRNFRY